MLCFQQNYSFGAWSGYSDPAMINISRIDLNLFVVFDAIYTEGGITRASEVLKLTQPAVSHALARLRTLVDDPLFVRQGHRMSPTPVAHELIGPVRRAIGEIEGSLSQLSRFDPQTSQREFKIGMHGIVELATIPALMELMGAAAPGIRIASVYHNRSDFQTHLSSGKLAAAIDVLVPVTHNIHKQRLAGGKMVVIARKDHPVVQGRISLETYLAQEHVLSSTRMDGPGMEDVELSRLGWARHIRLRCQNYWTACKIVSTTDLLLTMPERYARAANAPLDNQLLPFPIPMAARDIYLYWHASVESDQANRWLRDQLVASFDTPS
jgi:DNA-binding transcriptional LysR family regulator